ncbi:hypothetical protein ACTPEM_25665 [Clostridioides difficile]
MKENLFNNNSKIEINTNNKKITVKKDKLIIAEITNKKWMQIDINLTSIFFLF